MKKLLAVVCACLCLGLSVTAYAENESDVSAESTVSVESVESVEEVESTLPSEDVSSEEVSSEAVSSDDEYNLVNSENIIVNYAATNEELPAIGALIWTICGILLAGCLVIFGYKFIKWRQSK